VSAAATTTSSYGPGGAPTRSPDRSDLAIGGLIGVGLAAIAFIAQGGLLLGRATAVEIAVTIIGATLTAAAILKAPRQSHRWGSITIAALAALTALTVLSVIWSVAPEDSWLDANRAISYLFVFSGAASLARLAPSRWPSILFAVAAASLIVCTWALISKVFPSLAETTIYARLREPFGYWNAIGLMAALGVAPLLWLGSRREGSDLLRAAAWPAAGLLLLVVALAYSRGSALALIIGGGLWFAVVPLRLRALALLLPAALVAGLLSAYAFSQDGLSADKIALDQRATSGHLFGLFIVIGLGALYAGGLWVCRAQRRSQMSEQTRRGIAVAALCVVCLVPVVAVVGIATSSGGISGTWRDLTDPNAKLPSNDPGRLTTLGSVRSRYWRDAGLVFSSHEILGAGAEGYATVRKRVRDDTINVRHAHGFFPQTLADLGLVGIAVALALLAAWLASAARATGLRRCDRGLEFSDERVGLLTIAVVVVVFGIHSLIDWTWAIPGLAITALVCAGFLSGRGPLGEGRASTAKTISPKRLVATTSIVVIAAASCWAIWQPLRSVDANNDALAALAAGSTAQAAQDAKSAHALNPLSIAPLFTSAIIADSMGQPQQALAYYEEAVRLAPANPLTWRELGQYLLVSRNDPRSAYPSLRAALYLDPRGATTASLFLTAERALNASKR